MGGVLKQAWTKLRDWNLNWAVANFADRPLWATPYFLAALVAAAAARRSRYHRWHRRRGQAGDDTRKVSVLMTTFNTGGYVTRAVESILAQSHANIELIVVDDASTDDTFAILQSLEMSDARMRAFRLSRNSGTYFAKNVARLIARGDYFATHDSDDSCHPDWLRFHVSAHLAFPEIVASQNHYVRVDEEGRVIRNRGVESRPALASMVYNNRVVTNAVGFFDSVRMAADREFSDRIVLSLGKDRILRFKDRHYRALVRDGQLTAESSVSLTARGNNESDYVSPARLDYIRAAGGWHRSRHPNDIWMRFPLRDRHFPVPASFHPHKDGYGQPIYDGGKVAVEGCGQTRTVSELLAAYRQEFLDE